MTLAACSGGGSGNGDDSPDASSGPQPDATTGRTPDADVGSADAAAPAADAAGPDALVGTDNDGDGVTVEAGDCDDNDATVAPGKLELCDHKDNNCNGAIDEGYDADMDGFTTCDGDCDPNYSGTYPGAPEQCDFQDNNCDGMIDEGLDTDGDGFNPPPCGGDCDNGDATVHPGAPEILDGKDNDCNGGIDEPFTDNDGDGFTEVGGDCNDADPLVNPGAIEVPGDLVDNNCNGVVDEPLAPCDTGALDPGNPMDYAKAIGLCHGEVVAAQFVSGVTQARTITTGFGTYTGALARPTEGSKMVLLSTGQANTSSHDIGFAYDGDTTTTACTSSAHPDPKPDPGACGAADPATVCDKTEIKLTIKVPTNAKSFSYQFQFYSSEYPTWRCTQFDDTFLAELTSGAYNGNISFDASGHVVSVNNGFFDVCFNDNPNANGGPPNICTTNPVGPLGGTGFNPSAGGDLSIGAGATTPLTTTAPVLPGETITLRFIIFDEGDDILDSSVVLDNFKWSLNPSGPPMTQ